MPTGTCVFAQHADTAFYKHNQPYFWGEIIGGAGNVGISVGASASLMINRLVLSTRIYREQEVTILGNRPHDRVDEYALTAGTMLSHNKFGNYIISTGLSVVKTTTRGAPISYPGFFGGDFQPVYHTLIGLPLEIKYHNNFGFGGIAGFSCAATADINSVRPFYNLTFAIALGYQRERKAR